jgi:hypothetical protein
MRPDQIHRFRLGSAGVLSVAAGVLGGLVVVAYVVIMAMEGNNPWGQVVAWTLLMAGPSVLAFASLRLPRPSARWSRVAAAALFAAFGVVTSLGLGFWPAAVLAGLAAYRTTGVRPIPADQRSVQP